MTTPTPTPVALDVVAGAIREHRDQVVFDQGDLEEILAAGPKPLLGCVAEGCSWKPVPWTLTGAHMEAFCRHVAQAVLAALAAAKPVDPAQRKCPCFYPDFPEGSTTCECGHEGDEHDGSGDCTVMLDVDPPTWPWPPEVAL